MAPDVMEAAKAAIEALGYGPVLLTRLAASRGHDDAVVLRPMPTTEWCATWTAPAAWDTCCRSS